MVQTMQNERCLLFTTKDFLPELSHCWEIMASANTFYLPRVKRCMFPNKQSNVITAIILQHKWSQINGNCLNICLWNYHQRTAKLSAVVCPDIFHLLTLYEYFFKHIKRYLHSLSLLNTVMTPVSPSSWEFRFVLSCINKAEKIGCVASKNNEYSVTSGVISQWFCITCENHWQITSPAIYCDFLHTLSWSRTQRKQQKLPVTPGFTTDVCCGLLDCCTVISCKQVLWRHFGWLLRILPNAFSCLLQADYHLSIIRLDSGHYHHLAYKNIRLITVQFITHSIYHGYWRPVDPRNHAISSHGNNLVNSSPPSAAYMRQWICSALVQIMACRLFGTKPLSKPTLGYCQLDP